MIVYWWVGGVILTRKQNKPKPKPQKTDTRKKVYVSSSGRLVYCPWQAALLAFISLSTVPSLKSVKLPPFKKVKTLLLIGFSYLSSVYIRLHSFFHVSPVWKDWGLGLWEGKSVF